MATSTRFFCLAAIATVVSCPLVISATPVAQEVASRASGRIVRGSITRGHLESELAYRGSGRFDSQGGSGLLAYRGSGRLSQGLKLAYRGSERGVTTA